MTSKACWIARRVAAICYNTVTDRWEVAAAKRSTPRRSLGKGRRKREGDGGSGGLVGGVGGGSRRQGRRQEEDRNRSFGAVTFGGGVRGCSRRGGVRQVCVFGGGGGRRVVGGMLAAFCRADGVGGRGRGSRAGWGGEGGGGVAGSFVPAGLAGQLAGCRGWVPWGGIGILDLARANRDFWFRVSGVGFYLLVLGRGAWVWARGFGGMGKGEVGGLAFRKGGGGLGASVSGFFGVLFFPLLVRELVDGRDRERSPRSRSLTRSSALSYRLGGPPD